VIIIFLGPPGSGKGTQSLLVSEKMSIPHLSTGDVLRDEVERKTEIGNKVGNLMSSGQLVPSFLVDQIVRSRLESAEMRGCVLDGYPRTLDQAEFLYSLSLDQKIVVIYLEIHKDALINRVLNRYTCSSCGAIYNKNLKPTAVVGVCDSCGGQEFKERSDDNIDSMQNRLDLYYDLLDKLLPFFESRGNFFKVNAEESVEKIQDNIATILKMS
jgi:adenylate kinase